MMADRVDFIETGGSSPDGAYAFLQWKGTDACFDFTCDCGATGHFDGYFAYAVKCGGCGQEWEMPGYLHPRKLEPSSAHNPVTLEMNVYDGRGPLITSATRSGATITLGMDRRST